MSDDNDMQLPPQAIALRLSTMFELSQAVATMTRLGIGDLLDKHAMKSDEKRLGRQPR
jgi:hypothetical protein